MNLSAATLVFEPMLPLAAIAFLGLGMSALAIWAYGKTGARLPRGRRLFLLLFRLLAILLICGLLLQPMSEESIPRRHPQRVVLVAIDTSQSMGERDAEGQIRRLDAARQWLAESGLLDAPEGEFGDVRMFQFSDNAGDISPGMLPGLPANGETTHFHQSLSTVLGSLRRNEHCVGLFVFSDGHDFELVPAARTAQVARSKQAPVYAVALGRENFNPDVAVHLTSYRPYTFINQRAQLQAAVRLTGSEPRPLRVELLREGVFVRDRTVTVGSGTETQVSFEVAEAEPGQVEYEFRVTPLPGEREVGNNSAFTFLNVTDAKIPVLLIEGSPHWDSTFLRRTLSRNERVELTSIFSLGPGKAPQITSSNPEAGELTMPESREDFERYPLIILGREITRMLSADNRAMLAAAVEEGGTTLVFARGRPGDDPALDELAPAPWLEGATGPVRLAGGQNTAQIVPMEVLATAPGGADALPDLLLVRELAAPKTLASVEALAEDSNSQSTSPAFVHRRHGQGQVFAVAVGGMWKWSLNARAEATNNVYDRFWNQLLLNLVARSSASPGNEARLTVNSANIALGEKVSFTLHPSAAPAPTVSPLTIFREDEADSTLSLTKEDRGTSWHGAKVMDRAGRYRALTSLDGRKLECRFAVFEEKRETTELAPDLPYLRELAERSGGKLLDRASLKATVESLGRAAIAEADAPPVILRKSLWDQWGFFYLLFLLLGIEWFFRRRWGLI